MHFTVAVIHHPNQNVEHMLAPFDENLDVEYYDARDEYQEMYDSDKSTVEVFITPDGEKHLFGDSALIREITEEEFNELYNKGTRGICRKQKVVGKMEYTYFDPQYFHAKRTVLPYHDVMSFKEFMEEYHGYSDGEYGYYYNPNAKWDWYSIGGRWNGLIRLKDGCTGEIGNDGAFGHSYDYENENRASSARICDIDFSRNEAEYERAIRFWEVVVEDSPLRENEDESMFNHCMKKEYYQNKYKTKERFADEMSSFVTSAVLTPDGEWHEADYLNGGDREWFDNYEQFINNADPDDVMTIVDCHV